MENIERHFVKVLARLFCVWGPEAAALGMEDMRGSMFLDGPARLLFEAVSEALASGVKSHAGLVEIMRAAAAQDGRELRDHDAWHLLLDGLVAEEVSRRRSLENATECAAMIMQAAARRKIEATAAHAADVARNPMRTFADVIEAAEHFAAAAAEKVGREKELLADIAAQMENDENAVTPVPTGHKWWDCQYQGFWPGLTVFAGKPGCGKSALALQLVAGALMEGEPGTAIWGLGEMTQRQIVERLAACFSQRLGSETSMAEVREWRDLGRDAVKRLVGSIGNRLAVVSDISIPSLAAAVARYKAKILVLDYLQLVPAGGGESRYEQLESAATDLLRLCRVNDVCVIAISSLAKSAGPDAAIGQLSKGTGSFDYAAGAFYLVDVPEGTDRSSGSYPVTISCKKNRYGGLRDIQIDFDGDFQRFGHRLIEEFADFA